MGTGEAARKNEQQREKETESEIRERKGGRREERMR